MQYFLLVVIFVFSIPLYVYGSINNREQSRANGISIKKKQLKTIIVDQYYPYTFVNQQWIPDGYSVDLMKAVTQVMGLELKTHVDTWEHARIALRTGAIDFLPMMAYSSERDRFFDFSVPHTIAYDAFFTKKDAQRIRSIDDLRGKTIIVMKNDQAHDYLLSIGLTAPDKMILVDSLPEALRVLASGQGDATLMPKLVGLIIINNLNLTNLEQSPIVIESYNRPFSFAVKEGDQLLLERLTQGLNILKESGQYSAIYSKWFGALEPKELPFKAVLKYILVVFIALVLIGLALALWSIFLRKQVAIRTRNLEKEIHERKQAEEALKESEAHLRTLVRTIPDLVWLKDQQGIYLFCNSRFESFFGAKEKDIIGKTDYDFVDKELADFFRKHDKVAMAKGKPSKNEEEVTFADDGHSEILETIKTPMYRNDGQLAGVLGIGRDITDRKRAELEKSRFEEQYRQTQKIEAIGALAGGVAHDFNNILGIILGNTELAIDDVPKWNPVRLNLEEIRTASHRAKDVVRQLLSFARKTKLEKKPTNIIPVIKESLQLMRSSIPTSTEIRQNIPKDIDTILADPTQINQVLINLCTNADHAMPDGGVIEVTLKNVELDEDTAAEHLELNSGSYVNLTISDTGHGISQEEIGRIFDPYFTTKEVGKGTGIGLAVVHGIVKEHNGLITAESELGKGTSFSLFFPVIKQEAVVETETDEELPTGSEKILFIDDEESIVELGRQRLERLGYKVEATTSPIEALELFRSHPDKFDLVITDLTMPKMPGDKLVQEILNIRPDIPVILCTGFSKKIDEKKSKEIGAADYIEKPLDKRNFAFKVRKTLDAE